MAWTQILTMEGHTHGHGSNYMHHSLNGEGINMTDVMYNYCILEIKLTAIPINKMNKFL